MSTRPGWLRVVGTPLGNLGDFSERGKAALAECDVILCEDSRRSGRLVQQVGLPKRPFLVANEHTEQRIGEEVERRIAAGERFALISDAGMPGISDPGQRLIARLVAAGIAVDVVPGPTALVGALVLSGLNTDRFVFEGFLARKGKDRQAQLAEIAQQPRTTVFYESPKRVRATLNDLASVCGQSHPVALARELTKLHEQVVRGTVESVIAHFVEHEPRGEFVFVVGGCPAPEPLGDAELRELVLAELDAGASRRDAVASVVAQSGASKNRVYQLSTEQSSTEEP